MLADLSHYCTYLGEWSQQGKLCGADVDRKRADVKPANQNKETLWQTVQKQVEAKLW